MDIGCRECGHPSELVMLSDDLGAVKERWARETLETRGPGRPKPAPFEARNPDVPYDDSGWPSNVVALDGDSSHAWVVYEVTADV